MYINIIIKLINEHIFIIITIEDIFQEFKTNIIIPNICSYSIPHNL